MLQVSNLSKTYGDDVILEGVSFVVNPGQRVGLIGPNGCGKTTLLRIIVGQEQPDRGSVRFSPADVTVGYLAQALEFEPGATVGDVMRQVVEGLREAERQVKALARQMAMAQGDALAHLMDEYAEALARFEAAGGYGVSHEVDAVLAGLGLEAVDQATPVATLSGGQKTRLGLARLLQLGPQFLLLDEPTNHLDIEALEWLEEFLADYDGAVIVVSHDRAFLDRAVHTILELDPLTHTVTAYPGNYSQYWQAKEREQEKQWATYKDQQERIAQIEAGIQGLAGHARRIERRTTHFHYRKIAKGLARRAVVQKQRHCGGASASCC
jgi:ATPase subunit of ABC transporter with duplicated ATPase domains